jgi:hypothetical protein
MARVTDERLKLLVLDFGTDDHLGICGTREELHSVLKELQEWLAGERMHPTHPLQRTVRYRQALEQIQAMQNTEDLTPWAFYEDVRALVTKALSIQPGTISTETAKANDVEPPRPGQVIQETDRIRLTSKLRAWWRDWGYFRLELTGSAGAVAAMKIDELYERFRDRMKAEQEGRW